MPSGPIEKRERRRAASEAAKLCIDWYAASDPTDSVGSCRRGCAVGEVPEPCHPLILMMRNLGSLLARHPGQHDMAIRKFSALLADMKHCPDLP